MKQRLSLMVLAMLLAFANPARAELVVFAAASLKEPLDRLAAEFGDVVVSYGGSGTLARQITLGAPADLVFLAHTDWMDVLTDGGWVEPDSVTDIAGNALVFIGPADADDLTLNLASIEQVLGAGRIATGLTKAVPAGIYAKAALTSLGLWNGLMGDLAEVDNVRAALALVARGQAPLGIVYATDARVSDAVRVVATFPRQSHPPIRYLGAVVAGEKPESASFLDYVTGLSGVAALTDAGFLPVAEVTQ